MTYVYARGLQNGSPEWHKARTNGIGGSDAAAIVGMNEYASPYSVWADKLGMVPPKPDNEAMRTGRDLEDYVARRFTEKSGLKVRRVNAIVGNDRYPFALANIDREVLGDTLPSGLECKTASALSMGQYKGGAFPDRYYCQCVHYMAVTGKMRWYLAILIMGREFYVYQLTRVENDTVPQWCNGSVFIPKDEIDALMGAEEAFWKDHVLTRLPPPMDGTEATTQALEITTGSKHPTEEEKLLHCADAFKNWSEINQQIKLLNQQKELCRQQILTELGDAHKGSCGAFTVTNSVTVSHTFSMDAFRADHPHMDLAKYYKEGTSTRLTIKEVKQK